MYGCGHVQVLALEAFHSVLACSTDGMHRVWPQVAVFDAWQGLMWVGANDTQAVFGTVRIPSLKLSISKLCICKCTDLIMTSC